MMMQISGVRGATLTTLSLVHFKSFPQPWEVSHQYMNTLALHDRQVRSLQKVCLRHCHLSRVKLRRRSLPTLIVVGETLPVRL